MQKEKNKPTPGPWKVTHDIKRINYPWIIRSKWNKNGICELAIILQGKGNTEANARLISAAPELLEACNEGLAFIWQVQGDLPYKVSPEISKRIEQAIAKATKE